jgi:hypothetical protein
VACSPKDKKLQRYWPAEGRHRLGRIRDDHKAVGGGRDQLLAGVGSAAALDQPAVGADLICSIDRDVESVDVFR